MSPRDLDVLVEGADVTSGGSPSYLLKEESFSFLQGHAPVCPPEHWAHLGAPCLTLFHSQDVVEDE